MTWGKAGHQSLKPWGSEEGKARGAAGQHYQVPMGGVAMFPYSQQLLSLEAWSRASAAAGPWTAAPPKAPIAQRDEFLPFQATAQLQHVFQSTPHWNVLLSPETGLLSLWSGKHPGMVFFSNKSKCHSTPIVWSTWSNVLSFGNSTSSLFCRDQRKTETGSKWVVRPLKKPVKQQQRMFSCCGVKLDSTKKQLMAEAIGSEKKRSNDSVHWKLVGSYVLRDCWVRRQILEERKPKTGKTKIFMAMMMADSSIRLIWLRSLWRKWRRLKNWQEARDPLVIDCPVKW